MKKILSFIVFFTLTLSFVLPLIDEIYLSKKEALVILFFFSGLTILSFLGYWYLPILRSVSNAKNSLEEFKKQINASPKIIVSYTPKLIDSNISSGLQSVNGIIVEKWFSSVYSGIALLGFGGQMILWLGDMSSLTSGVFGAPLKYGFGRSLFSIFSVYFLILGSSVFFFGCVAKFFSWRYK